MAVGYMDGNAKYKRNYILRQYLIWSVNSDVLNAPSSEFVVGEERGLGGIKYY